MKEIKLSQGKVALVDDDDYEWLIQFKWFAHKDCKTFYAGRTDRQTGKQLWMHREIMHTEKGMQVDHIDTMGLITKRVIYETALKNRITPIS